MKNKLFFIILIVVVIAIIFGVSKFTASNRIQEVNAEDIKEAPEFTLLDIDGTRTSLSDFKGKVIILDFWATWCPPCKAEIPHFVELYDEYKKKGLEVIGVSLDSNPEKSLPSFMEEYRINYTMLIANRNVTDSYGGIISIPTTFVIDRNGNIRKKYIGYRDKHVFENDIEELL